MEDHELEGIPVLVNQQLQHDPAGKTGETGLILLANRETDEFFVRFDDGVVGLYAADALMLLKPCGEIFQYMEDNKTGLTAAAYEHLENIAFLDVYFLTDIALKNAAQNPAFHTVTMISLEDQLSLSLGQGKNNQLKR